MSGVFVKTRTPRLISSHLLVLVQLTCLFFCCYPQGWRNTGPGWWLVLCLLGALLGLCVLFYNRPSNFSVYPEISIDAKLVIDGPYKFIRHPMYTALMIMMTGIAGYNGHWINYAAAAGIIAVVSAKALREEKLLTLAFPHYRKYAAPLKRFIPGVL